MKLSKLFTDFFESEKASGFVLLICTTLSLLIANSSLGGSFQQMWHYPVFSKPAEFWINDGLMTVFFFLVGLEIEREFYIGELSDLKKSMLPVIAAAGGMLVPAFIHFIFNHNTPYQSGAGIPMATDIAFSLAVLSLLGNKVPASLKIFLTALAIIDDLGAIIIIALFYSKEFSTIYFTLATAVFAIMIIMNRLKIQRTWIYLILGGIMWIFMYRSGIHATITGVLLAFAIPFGKGDERSGSHRLQKLLHKPVAFIILPLFVLANTAVTLSGSIAGSLSNTNSYGIILGLLLGKPLGIFLFSITGVALGLCAIPSDIKKIHLLGAGILAGIGFTMSIFITLLAFGDTATIEHSKMAIMMGSLLSGLSGFIALKFSLKKEHEI